MILKDLYKKRVSDVSRGYEGDMASALGPLEKAIAMFQPGGEYGKGLDVSLARGKKKAVAGGMQSMVSSGLAGTTMPAGLGMQFEEEVAAPARASIEESRMGQLASLYSQKSGVMADILSRMRDAISKISVTRSVKGPGSDYVQKTGPTPRVPSAPTASTAPREGSRAYPSQFPNLFGGSGGTPERKVSSQHDLSALSTAMKFF